jgi:hypothetical protein
MIFYFVSIKLLQNLSLHVSFSPTFVRKTPLCKKILREASIVMKTIFFEFYNVNKECSSNKILKKLHMYST